MNDLYRDAKNVQDVDELEKKLAVLESEAAAVINILHEENGPCTIAPRRPQVETLRKFLFLMHYRSVRLSKTYFQRDHPDNTPIRQWLSEYRKKHNLNSDVDVWLHDLRYYLDTPHTQIIRDADAMVDQCGGLKVVEEMMKTHIDPGVENFSALAYKSQADFYFLCIWEAAENEEFTLGDNSFGLWEGRLLGKPGLHRLFAVGPRIVIILRDVHLDPALGPLAVPLGAVNSDLAAIPQDRPKPIYSNSALTPEDLAQHRLSAGAKKDKFEFKVTKLTRDQTFEVNKVFLENVRTDGSLTFISKERTLSTLRQYLRHPTSWPMNDVHKTTPKYRKLLSILEADVASMSQNILPQNPTNPSPSSVDQLNAELGTCQSPCFNEGLQMTPKPFLALAGLQVSDEPKADAKVMPSKSQPLITQTRIA